MGVTSPIYQRTMVIVHGKSEFAICRNIKSNLRLPQKIIANSNGRSSIQITSIMQTLNDSRFKTPTKFKRSFPEIEYKKSLPVNFQLFAIMDTDDCTEKQKNAYIDGSMFKGHWLNRYIVPIYNSPNLEQTMKEAGIPVTKKADYIVLFPTNNGDLDMDKAKDLLFKLKQCKSTNMDQYLECCITLAEHSKW